MSERGFDSPSSPPEYGPADAENLEIQPTTGLREKILVHGDMYRLPGDPPLTEKDFDRYVESNAEIRRTLPQLIEQGLKDGDPDVRQQIAGLIGQAPEADRARLGQRLVTIIEQGLKDDDPDVRRQAAESISQAPEADRARLIEAVIADNPEIRTVSTSTPLYKSHSHRFFRGKFAKSGSGTTLLDIVPGQLENSLRERLIIRHIGLGPYLSWRDIYENAEAWQAAGFDYVPIEPIVKVVGEKRLTVDAFTRVLRGPSVASWKQTTGLHRTEIDRQIEAINATLEKLGLVHGHPHENNFIVLFDRDERDEPIIDRPPRVYMIDFDAAVSSGTGGA